MEKIDYKELPILEDSDIKLRPIKLEDTEFIIKWRNSPEVKSKFIYRSDFTKEGHINWLNSKVFTGEVIQYIVEINSISVGSVYLRDIDSVNSCAEFGIFLGESFSRGKGFGVKITKLFTEFFHKYLKLHRIYLRLLADNVCAYKTYRKAGFITDGLFRDMVLIDGKFCDVIFMSSIKEMEYES